MNEANTRRIPVVVRLAPSGIAALDRLATAAGVTRSEMVRSILAEGVAARTTARVTARDVRDGKATPNAFRRAQARQ